MKNKINHKITQLLKNKNLGIKLDLGCGANKQGPDWFGIDARSNPGVDLVHDLESFPYPLPSGCASLAVAANVVEHINPHKGVFLKFMNEVWRLMRPDSEFLIATPYAGSPGYWQDPTHCNPCNEATWEYFDPLGPLSNGELYKVYRPLPWRIKLNTWNVSGGLEVCLVKRRIDPSYSVDPDFLAKL